MAFTLTIIKLEEALKKSGCPICRLEHESALQSIDSFLWENVNDPQARQPVDDAYGFCPSHTRMLVAKEMMASGCVQAVNIIYENLAKNASRDLQKLQLQAKSKRFLSALAEKLGLPDHRAPESRLVQNEAVCPVCILVEKSTRNILSTLFEELEHNRGAMRQSLRQSAGLCWKHLRFGLEWYGSRHEQAARFLIEDSVSRLDSQRALMGEYLRKHNWSYQDEKLTPAESRAWLQTLTFFTGLPPERFSHHIDEF